MDAVLVELDGPLATITLNRPRVLNALDGAMLEGMERALDTLECATGVRVVVVRGAGRAFSSGLDLNMRADGVDVSFFGRQEQVRLRLETLAAISVADVHGYCLGGGLQLALACDLRVARRNAVFGLPAVVEGIFPGLATVRLPRLIGLGPARRMILGGEQVGAVEAARIGLVDYLVDDAPSAGEDFAAIVRRFLEVPPTAAAASRQLMRAAFEQPLRALAQAELPLFSACLQAPDSAAAIAAWQARSSARALRYARTSMNQIGADRE